MAVVMMASNEKNNTTTNNKNPIFHDFLGTTSGGDSPSAAVWTKSREIHRAVEEEADVEAAEASASVGASSAGHALVLASSDLGSERQPMNNFEHFQFHGRGKDISEPELNNRFSGKKRSYSDSVFMGLTRERMLPAASDSFESSCLMKMFGKDVVSERPRRSRDDELMFAMQPPPRPNSTSIILNPPFSNKPDSVVSKWECSVPTIAGPMVHCASRFGQGGTCVDKYSSPHPYKDSSADPALVSQAAADEGSRTGMKGTGILNVLKSCGVGERNSSGMLPCSSRQKVNPQSTAPESSNIPSHRSIATASRQMTIFYGGQAHVFDDVHPNKADVIMGLAGSNGGSWSTKFSPRPPIPEAKVPSVEKEMGTSSLAFSKDLNNRLSVQQNCNPGFDQVGRVPLVGDPKSSTSGGHLGVRNFTDTRPINQAAEPDTEGKKNI